MSELVFVYGTLRQNESNHAFMDGAELVSEQAYIYGQLWDTGLGYPAVVLSQQSRVYGELYCVNTEQLQQLDVLEGYYGPEGPNDYERVKQTVYTPVQIYIAYVYIYDQPPVGGVCLQSGDWKVERFMT